MKGSLKLFRLKLREIKNSLKFFRDSRFKIFVVTLASLFFLGGLFLLFLEGFQFIQTLPLISFLIVKRLLYLLFLLIFFLLVFSAIVSSYTTLFSRGELDLLFSLPLPYSTLFFVKYLESVFYSSWAFIFVGFPFIMAYSVSLNLPVSFLGIFLIASLPYIFLSASIGILFTQILSRILSLQRWRVYLFAFLVLLTPLFYLFYKMSTLPPLKPELLLMVKQVFRHFRLSQHPYLPGYWISTVLFSFQERDWSSVLRYLSYLYGGALVSFFVNLAVSEKFYFPAFSNSRGSVREKRVRREPLLVPLLRKTFFFLPYSWRALVLKDVKTFFRDARQWSQFLIFFGILLFYIVNLRYYAYIRLNPSFKLLVSMVNLASMGFILSTLTIRFIYPQISLEGRRVWLLKLSSLGLREVVWEKFLLTTFLSLGVVAPLILLTNYFLRNPLYFWFLSLYLVVLMSLGISALSVGLGAVFPNFSSDNPAKIVSGFGGTLTFVLTMVYILLLISLNTIPFYYRFVLRMGGDKLFFTFLRIAVFWSAGITLFTVYFPLRYGIRKISQLEG